MKIGIAYDLKPQGQLPAGAPDDLHEEFDSPITVQAIAKVIEGLGHIPVLLGGGREFLEKMLREPPDLVFNFAEGTGVSRNRESRVPAVCEMLNVPHTGSDVLTLALCLDKDMCRRTVGDADVQTPEGILITFQDKVYDGDYAEFPGMVEESELKYPLIAKPVCEGSSKGIRSKCLIEKPEDVGPVVVSLWHDYQQGVLLEEFIEGDEVTIGVIGNDPPEILGMMKIIPKLQKEKFIYSLEVKRDWIPVVSYETPAQYPHDVMIAIEDAALAAYEILGIRDLARLDFRIKDGVPYFIEANPLPGLNPEISDLTLLINGYGITHTQMVERVINSAITRAGL